MKLLMLGWELPPHNSGGLGVACYHMAKAIAHRGVSIDFVVPYSADHPDTHFMRVLAATNVQPGKRQSTELAYSMSYHDIKAVQRGYIGYVERYLEDETPDAIHAHDWLTMQAGVRAKEICGAPLIVHVHATEFDRSGSEAGNPLIHEIEYNGLMMADRILAVSNITKQMIVHRYGIPADKVEVVHNALDVASLPHYDYDRRTYNYLESLRDEGYTVVTTITRFTVQKGLTHLMRAAARASERYDRLVFLFAGDGEQRDELIELASELGISDKVYFTGFVRGKQWRDAYNVSDIFVMSSVSEPFGLTALEAAHHDTALIISKQSGVGEVLHGIFRYDFWDIDRLADQMIGIATSPALSSSLRIAAKSEYVKISWHDVAEKCLRAYKQLKSGAYA
jgi:glycogen synthase